MMRRPSNDEHSGFFSRYISLVPEGDIVNMLEESLGTTAAFLSGITEEQGQYRYAPGKWSLKQTVGHISDNERIMAYRLLRFARGDKTSQPGYDQDELMKGSTFDSWTMAELIGDYTDVRQATLSLIRRLTDEAWSRKGTASGFELSARALAYVIAGHELHHLAVIRERYLP